MINNSNISTKIDKIDKIDKIMSDSSIISSIAPVSITKFHDYICNECGKTTRLSVKDAIKCVHCRKCRILFKPRCPYTLQYEAR